MNFRDIELLSAYLDGQTSPSDSTRLEARLQADPELASAYRALRQSRGLVRQLPKRRAPRNFTLSHAMVGKKPPLPRSYSVFRLATALATLLFGLSFVTNQIGQMAAASPAPAYGYGVGGGRGGGEEGPPAARPQSGGGSDATEAPMMESAPAATEPGMAMLAPTATPEAAADQNRVTQEDQSAKNGEPGLPPASPARTPFQIPAGWQIGFAVVAVLGAGSMYLIQRLAAKKWRGK